jgi:tol-pal system protein YbgF
MGKPAETLLRAAALWALAAGQTAWAVDESYATIANLIERVGRLEQRMSGQALATMVGQSEELRTELRSLRGDLEQLGHDIEELKQQQRSQYQDLDQRLQALAGGGAAAPAAGKPPAAGDAGAAAGQPPAPAAADAEAAKQAYQKAFNSLKEGRYKEATGLFKAFLAAYPNGDNVDNAQYWLGESYYVTRDFNAAKEAFRKVVDGYPKSAKAADALLRLGYIEYDSEHWSAAAQVLADVSKRYPGSSAAQQAQARLQKMKQEGH